MRPPRLLALLALAALACPPLAGATSPPGLTVTAATAQGAARVEGPLVALWQQDAFVDAPADPAFTLRADLLRVEADTAEAAVPNPLDPVWIDPHTGPRQEHAQALVEGASLRAGHRWTVLASDPLDPPRFVATGGCAQASAAPRDTLVRRPLVNPGRGDEARDLSHALAWSCLRDARVEVTGNLTLTLWAWNATLTSGGGRQDLGSGTGPAALGDPTGSVRREDELYLVATGATLTLRLAGGSAAVYTGPGTALTASRLDLDGATGDLDAAGRHARLGGSSVAMQGSAHASLAGQGAGQPFAARLDGEGRVSVDGRELATPAALPRVSPLALPALLAVGLLAVGSAEVRRARLAGSAAWGLSPTLLSPPETWRERRAMGHWMLARRAALGGRMGWARAHLRRALRWFPASLDARLLDAALLVRRGRHAAALHTLGQLYGELGDGPERFEVATMASSSAMLASRPAEAVAWLRKAAAADPLAFTQEVKRPIYDALDDAWFCAARISFARAYLAGGLDPAFS